MQSYDVLDLFSSSDIGSHSNTVNSPYKPTNSASKSDLADVGIYGNTSIYQSTGRTVLRPLSGSYCTLCFYSYLNWTSNTFKTLTGELISNDFKMNLSFKLRCNRHGSSSTIANRHQDFISFGENFSGWGSDLIEVGHDSDGFYLYYTYFEGTISRSVKVRLDGDGWWNIQLKSTSATYSGGTSLSDIKLNIDVYINGVKKASLPTSVGFFYKDYWCHIRLGSATSNSVSATEPHFEIADLLCNVTLDDEEDIFDVQIIHTDSTVKAITKLSNVTYSWITPASRRPNFSDNFDDDDNPTEQEIEYVGDGLYSVRITNLDYNYYTTINAQYAYASSLVSVYSLPFIPLQASYSTEVQGNSVRTTMFDGRSRQRSLPSALRPYRKLNCQFLLTDDELAEFQSYLDNECNGGADWFNLQVLGDDNILETKKVRLINGEYTVSLVHNKGDEVLWRLTADFEVK